MLPAGTVLRGLRIEMVESFGPQFRRITCLLRARCCSARCGSQEAKTPKHNAIAHEPVSTVETIATAQNAATEMSSR